MGEKTYYFTRFVNRCGNCVMLAGTGSGTAFGPLSLTYLIFVRSESSSAPDTLLLEHGQRLGQHRITVQRWGGIAVLQPDDMERSMEGSFVEIVNGV